MACLCTARHACALNAWPSAATASHVFTHAVALKSIRSWAVASFPKSCATCAAFPFVSVARCLFFRRAARAVPRSHAAARAAACHMARSQPNRCAVQSCTVQCRAGPAGLCPTNSPPREGIARRTGRPLALLYCRVGRTGACTVYTTRFVRARSPSRPTPPKSRRAPPRRRRTSARKPNQTQSIGVGHC